MLFISGVVLVSLIVNVLIGKSISLILDRAARPDFFDLHWCGFVCLIMFLEFW